ncbi:MAG TPA: carboxypeptidase M32, partial [Kiloniellaceae bacterium]
MTAYEELSRRFKRLRALQEAAGVLQWDMSAMMPSGGAEARTEQLATLSVVCHEILADPKLDELFDRAS